MNIKKREGEGKGGRVGHLHSDPKGPEKLANDLCCSVSSGR